MTRALNKYTQKLVKLEKGGPSVNAALTAAKQAAQALNTGRDKVHKVDKGAR
jgi:hypothetical protein